MKQRTKILSLLMAIVMVLGVMVAIPMTVNATIAEYDLRHSYEFIKLHNTDGKYDDIIEYYKPIDSVPLTETAPTLDGVIDEDNYTVKREVLTHSYAAKYNINSNPSGNETTGEKLNEYFAQDADYIYIAFEMPNFTADVTPNLYIRSSTRYAGLKNQFNEYGMWNTPAIQIATTPSTGATTIAMNNGNTNSGSHTINFAKWTATGAETAAFAAPAEGETTAYVEYKISKTQLMETMGLSNLEDFSYVLQFTSKPVAAVQTNYVSNAFMQGSAAATAGNNSVWQQVFRYVRLYDYRYDCDAAITTIPEISATAPVADGTINADEYNVSDSYNGVDRYFAINGDYLYMAIDLNTELAAGKTFYLSLYAGNDSSKEASVNSTIQNTSTTVEKGISDLAFGFVAGGASANSANNNGSWKGAVSGKVNSETGVVEARISLYQLYNSNKGTVTSSAFYQPYDTLFDMNNIRYKVNYTPASTGEAVDYMFTPAGDDAKIYGTGARPFNLNFDLSNFPEVEDVRTDLGAFGYNSIAFNSTNATEVVIDGVIEDTEYAYTRDANSAYEQGNGYVASLAVNEYFGWTEDYVYMAFKLANAKLNDEEGTVKNVQLRLFTKDSGLASDASGDADMVIDLDAGNNETDDYIAYVTEDDAHNVTVEILVSKKAMAAAADLDFVDNFRYALYYNEYMAEDDQYRPVVNAIHATSTVSPFLYARLQEIGFTGGVLAKTVYITPHSISDITTDLENYYGIPNVDVVVDYENNVFVSDGIIEEDEYTVVNQAGEVTEYFAHDDDYFYFGFEVPEMLNVIDTNNFALRLFANNVGKLSEAMKTGVMFGFEFTENGVGCDISGAMPMIDGFFPVYDMTESDGITTIELAVDKASLANYLGISVSEIKNIGYAYSYKTVDTTIKYNAFLMEGVLAEEYELFDTDYNVKDGCYRIIDVVYEDLIVTTDAASITMTSVDNVAIRFKAAINTGLYNELVAEYGEENVKYGMVLSANGETEYYEGKIYSEYNTFFEIVVDDLLVPQTHFDTDIMAYGYIEVREEGEEGETYTYLYGADDNYTVRNVKDVAAAALEYEDYNNAAQKAALEIISAGI